MCKFSGIVERERRRKSQKKSPDRYSTLCCVCIDAIVTLGVFLYLFDFGQRVIYTQKTLTFIPNHLYSFFFSLSLPSISSMSNGICPGPVFNILVPVQLLNLDCIFNNVSPPAVTFSFWFSFFLFLLLLFFLPPPSLLLDIYCIHLFFFCNTALALAADVMSDIFGCVQMAGGWHTIRSDASSILFIIDFQRNHYPYMSTCLCE